MPSAPLPTTAAPDTHYENFPVASWLCPPRLRPPIAAIYAFARTADDIADEGDATPDQRLAELTAFRADLQAVGNGLAPSHRWPEVFGPLAYAIQQFALPVPLLDDLLSAFMQDIAQTRDRAGYADRPALLDYCRRSANPVGRLLLHLYGVTASVALVRSDAICSALQLINFWQDLSVDLPRNRYYLPQDACAAASLAHNAPVDDPIARRLIASQVDWAEALMRQGAPLVHEVQARAGWRAGWELRLVVQGGLRIIDKIRALNHSTLRTRPKLHATDALVLLWRALWM